MSRTTPPIDDPERLDESAGFLGSGRSMTFPFPQWRARDRHRTVFFDEGQGEPLVMVHGLGGNATHWEQIARALVRDHRVIGLDLVGCGWSAKPPMEYTVELLCDHLLEFIDARGLTAAALIGHSMGAAVCVEAAIRRPNHFRSLALICPHGLAPLPRWVRATAPLVLRRRLLYPYFRYGAGFALGSLFEDSPRDNPEVDSFIRSSRRDDPGAPNIKDFARVGESLCRDLVRRDGSRRLNELTLPVLFLQGSSDKMSNIRHTLKALSAIPRLRSIILDRCGHMPMVERPAQTLRHLERFLRDPPT